MIFTPCELNEAGNCACCDGPWCTACGQRIKLNSEGLPKVTYHTPDDCVGCGQSVAGTKADSWGSIIAEAFEGEEA